MALRTYSVVVRPQSWENPLEDLARLLAPVAGASSRDVLTLLRRGPMTVESDMSESSARRLEAKLRAMGVYPIVRGDDGSTLDDPEAGIAAMLNALSVDAVEVEDFSGRGLPTAQGIPAAPTVDVEGRQSGAVAVDPAARPDLAESRHERTLMGVGSSGVSLPNAVRDFIGQRESVQKVGSRPLVQGKSALADISGEDPFAIDIGMTRLDRDVAEVAGSDSGGGWESLFPGISGEVDVISDEHQVETSGPPVADLVVGTKGPSAPLPLEESEFPADQADTARTLLDTDIPEAVLAVRAVASPVSLAPSRVGHESNSSETGPAVESDFKVAQVSRALLSADDGKPPYQPPGYDDRPLHDPAMAALLSAIAPGAGQVYNGDDDQALSYGLRCFLVRPWKESVQDARSRAEKIAGYWAPRPSDGALFRAFRYVLIWWVCVGATIAVLVTMSSFVVELANRDTAPKATEVDVRRCFADAIVGVQIARIASLDALAAARFTQPKKFTMQDDERAERLFRVGYEYCKRKSYVDCENTMRKVNALQPGHRQALRLQTWASMNRRGRKKVDMPDVGVVESLGDFEQRIQNGRSPEPSRTGEDAGPMVKEQEAP